MTKESHGYGIYWIVWGVLLVLTFVMILIGEANIGYVTKGALLLLGAAVKASLIIFYFMHMRLEKAGLAVTVLVGIFLIGALMFALPAYDGSNVFQHLTYPPRP
jgi:caa(3)-type oxidase subunit IV